jgi:hypothetical protein
MASTVLSNLLATLKSTFRINKATIDASGLSVARTITLLDTASSLGGSNTGDQTITLTGDVTGSGTGSFATTIADDAVTFPKMAPVASVQRLIGLNDGTFGNPELVTAPWVLDWISTTRGAILYRGASEWVVLSPGTAGQVLKTNGAGADPAWGAAQVDLTPYHLVSAASTNATVVKASAGKLYGWKIYNNNAAMRKVAFHNAATTPTAGASILFTLNIPGLGAANVLGENPINFTTGIAFTTVTDNTDAGTTAVAAGDLTINLFYT